MTAPVCTYCNEPVRASDPFVWRRIVGWERKGHARTRRGGSDIVMREHLDEFACPGCMARLQAGLAVRQESLL